MKAEYIRIPYDKTEKNILHSFNYSVAGGQNHSENTTGVRLHCLKIPKHAQSKRGQLCARSNRNSHQMSICSARAWLNTFTQEGGGVGRQ